MSSLEQLFKAGVAEMKSYSPIEPPDQIANRLGIPEEQIIKLDANENPYGVSQKVLDDLGKAKYLSIYPDPAQKKTRAEIASYAGCKTENVVAGAGADELIDLICRLVINPGDKVLTFTPTFSYYRHVVELNGGSMVEIERREDYSIKAPELSKIALEKVKLVLLCSPNNPTGNMLEEEVLDFFLKKDLIVVVDEAYYEFSGSSYIQKINSHENLLVLRTFSKCFGLAGLRVGYGIMPETLQQAIMKIKPPYSVNMAAEIALQSCIKNKDQFLSQVQDMIITRNKTIEKLKEFSELEVYPTQANYILCKVKTKNAKKIRDDLETKGILLRHFNTPQLKNHIRISVGTPAQMETFLAELSYLL